MNWKEFSKEKPETSSEDVHFLVNDGKKIYCAYLNKRGEFYFHADINENYYEVEKRLTHWCYFEDITIPNQPERSKREDSQKCEMRCSEHCGNTVREAQ